MVASADSSIDAPDIKLPAAIITSNDIPALLSSEQHGLSTGDAA